MRLLDRWKPRLAPAACLAAAAVWTGSAAVAAAAPYDWAGDYVAVLGTAAELRIVAPPAAGAALKLRWELGGDDAQGAATSGRCIAVASGTATGAQQLVARLQPFDEGDQALDAADLAALKPQPLTLEVMDGSRRATLLRVQGLLPHCGLQAGIAGVYWRPAAAMAPETFSVQGCEEPSCMGAALKRHDDRLNSVYKVLAKRLQPAAREALKRAQRRWIAQRDALCGAAPASADLACQTRATQLRADELADVEGALQRERR